MLEKLDFSTTSVSIYHDSFVQLGLKLPLMSIYLLSKICDQICQPKNNICAFQNKAADFQKENQVLVLKELIGSLGSNKTEHAISTVSKAAPVIQDSFYTRNCFDYVPLQWRFEKRKFCSKKIPMFYR
jgi:hypothetical protein